MSIPFFFLILCILIYCFSTIKWLKCSDCSVFKHRPNFTPGGFSEAAAEPAAVTEVDGVLGFYLQVLIEAENHVVPPLTAASSVFAVMSLEVLPARQLHRRRLKVMSWLR